MAEALTLVAKFIILAGIIALCGFMAYAVACDCVEAWKSWKERK